MMLMSAMHVLNTTVTFMEHKRNLLKKLIKNNMNAHLKAIKKKHEALGDIARADLETYLNNQVAIGEHPDLGVEIEKKVETIAHHNEVVETINDLIAGH